MSLPEKGILYRLSAWLCRQLIGTRAEKRLRRKLREPLCRLHPLAQPEKVLLAYYTKQLRQILLVMLIGAVLTGFAAWLVPQRSAVESVSTLTRGSYGEGSSEETLRVYIGEETVPEELSVTVSPRAYTQEELDILFKESADSLETLILGENPSLGEVTSDLQLVEELPDSVITVWWQIDQPEIINADGSLNREALSEEGTIVELRAHLCAQEQEYIHTFAVCVRKSALEPAQAAKETLQEKIAEADAAQQTKETLTLPAFSDGQQIRYERGEEAEAVWPLLPVLTAVCAVLLVFGAKNDRDKALKARSLQMQLDYPEIVSKLTLLFGAGLSIREAWGRIVKAYVRQCERGNETRYAYEEMLAAYREMESGMAETEAYDRFAVKCGLSEYLKLSALLVQNIKKGTRSLTQMLIYESVQAMEERKSIAKRMGEEAGTKLLAPMVLMLAVVLLILVVPAFMSMGI